ncbi:MAG: PmoA family protein [Planctomycetaceae bacterium]
MTSLRRQLLPFLCLLVVSTESPGGQQVAFQSESDAVVITVDGLPVARYVYSDPAIPRPYFADVKVPGGRQVTRNHPPIEGTDAIDHASMHPGIWLAFGDLSGNDFWRNKASVVHAGFVQEPEGGDGRGSFVEEKRYLRPDGSMICREEFSLTVIVRDDGYLLVWDSTFRSDTEFHFGDQEEMGLGFRVATPISEVRGGRLSDSERRSGADNIWGNAAAWCDYSGNVDGQTIGITVMCHPGNFRPSWMHARNYGLVVANPFGRQAMKKGDVSKVTVRPGEELRLRYGIWLHGGDLPAERTPDDVFSEYRSIP